MTRPIVTARPVQPRRALPPVPTAGSRRTTTYYHGRVLEPASRRRRRPVALPVVVLALLIGGIPLLDRAPEVSSGPSITWPVQGQGAYTTSEIDLVRADGGQAPVPIASVTKVMTAYVVLQAAPLEPGEAGPTLRFSDADVADTERRRANGESVVAVASGEELTEMQALQALLVPSANNVAISLARWTAGSVEDFVERMNEAADDLGMADTTYTDPSGMADDTVSTAADQVRLFEAAMRDPVFAEVAGTTSVHLPVAGTVGTTSSLLGQHGFVAGKTGSHDAAGGCYAFRVVRQFGGRDVAITGVVLGQHGGPYVQAALSAAEALAGQVAASADARAA